MPLSDHRVFAHLGAERASIYRAILDAFVRAKQRFALHLRPGEIERACVEAGQAEDPSAIAVALAQLADWGNLEAHPDTADVATVEDFYRPRHLYQLTPTGEAAERALTFFESALRERGELQAVALADIRVLLEELGQVVAERPVDEGKAHRALLSLRGRFEDLTTKAQAFMASLQRTIDLHGLSLQALLAYKQSLIDYLERFIGELLLATAEITGLLLRLEDQGIVGLLEAVARREIADAMTVSPDERRAMENATQAVWTGRWQGLRAWFVSADGGHSQAEILRQRARSAIPALLSAVAGLNDRRVARSDRSADMRTLALWFAQAPDDEQAHRLWRAAFALSPARHLSIDDETLTAREQTPVPPQASWLDAAPIGISPRLRKSGRYTRRGPPSRVIDRSAERAALARLLEEETAQIQEARRRLAEHGSSRLSAFGMLDRLEFELLLDLLGEALARRVLPREQVSATSSDGSLFILMDPPDDGAQTTIETAAGWLRVPDFLVSIRESFTHESANGLHDGDHQSHRSVEP